MGGGATGCSFYIDTFYTKPGEHRDTQEFTTCRSHIIHDDIMQLRGRNLSRTKFTFFVLFDDL